MFYEFEIKTNKKEELIDITDKVLEIIKSCSINEGILHIFIPHATAGIILNESADPNIKIDFLNALDKAFPAFANYLHNKIDDNASGHIKSAMVGSSLTIPIHNGEIILGRWQSIMFCEFDGPRTKRKIILQIISD